MPNFVWISPISHPTSSIYKATVYDMEVNRRDEQCLPSRYMECKKYFCVVSDAINSCAVGRNSCFGAQSECIKCTCCI